MSALPELPGEAHARADVESGIYERERPILEGDVVLDIGAHVGYFTELALKRVGKNGGVIAMEPCRNTFLKLSKRLSQNEQLTLWNAAASDVSEWGTLHCNPLNTGANSIEYNCGSGQDEGVVCMNVGEMFQSTPLTFVKIDAEGMEYRIIKSLLFHGLRPFITFEAHSEKLYQDCHALLNEYGYRFVYGDNDVGVHWAHPK